TVIRIREPDAAVGMDRNVVGRVEAFPFELVRNYRDRAVRLVANDAPSAVLAGKLAAFVVEGVAVAVARWVSENRHAAVVLEPPHLDVVGDIAPDQIPADSVPRGTFRPQCSEMQSPDDGIADDVFLEAAVECDNI